MLPHTRSRLFTNCLFTCTTIGNPTKKQKKFLCCCGSFTRKIIRKLKCCQTQKTMFISHPISLFLSFLFKQFNFSVILKNYFYNYYFFYSRVGYNLYCIFSCNLTFLLLTFVAVASQNILNQQNEGLNVNETTKWAWNTFIFN